MSIKDRPCLWQGDYFITSGSGSMSSCIAANIGREDGRRNGRGWLPIIGEKANIGRRNVRDMSTYNRGKCKYR